MEIISCQRQQSSQTFCQKNDNSRHSIHYESLSNCTIVIDLLRVKREFRMFPVDSKFRFLWDICITSRQFSRILESIDTKYQ